MPCVQRQGYKIDARIHPAETEGSKYPTLRFRESTQYPGRNGGITSDVGVTRYDRIVSTINFFHLFRAKGEMIEKVKIETSVDEDKISSQTLDPVDIRRSGHTVQSPTCILKQDQSTVSIRIVAYYKTVDNVIYQPSEYNLGFKCTRYEGNPPIVFGPEEGRIRPRHRADISISRRVEREQEMARQRSVERLNRRPSLVLSTLRDTAPRPNRMDGQAQVTAEPARRAADRPVTPMGMVRPVRRGVSPLRINLAEHQPRADETASPLSDFHSPRTPEDIIDGGLQLYRSTEVIATAADQRNMRLPLPILHQEAAVDTQTRRFNGVEMTSDAGQMFNEENYVKRKKQADFRTERLRLIREAMAAERRVMREEIQLEMEKTKMKELKEELDKKRKADSLEPMEEGSCSVP